MENDIVNAAISRLGVIHEEVQKLLDEMLEIGINVINEDDTNGPDNPTMFLHSLKVMKDDVTTITNGIIEVVESSDDIQD